MQGAGIHHVRVHALLEAQLAGAAQVIALPVARAVGALAPILLHVNAVDHHLVGGAFIKASEIAAHHQEIRPHRKRQRHVIVMHDAAVGADGDVDPCLPEILVPGLRHLDQRGRLPAANALGLARDADRAAADAHLDEIRPRLRQEEEAVPVDHVARADLHGIAVLLADPGQRLFLPDGIALGGIDAQHVGASGQQRGNTLLIIPGVDPGAYQIALLAVQQLQGIFLMGSVILAEHEVHQPPLIVHNGQ